MFRVKIGTSLLLLAIAMSALAASGQGSDGQIYIYINLIGQTNPAISRFIGFTGAIPRASAERIDRATLRLFVNGIDRTFDLQIEKDAQKGDLYLAFRPSQSLPLGTVVERLVGSTTDGKVFDKQWFFRIDQGADPDLAPWAQILKQNEGDVNAHLQLAAAYERKYLLEDAAAEYMIVMQIDPENERARSSYLRIFSAWDRKSITQENICLEITKDLGLEKMGALVLFKVRIFNGTSRKIAVEPGEASLVIDECEEVPSLESLKTYPKEAYESGRINIENYARITYFLDTHTIDLLTKKEISPNVIYEGYLAFPLKRRFFKHFSLNVPIRAQGKSQSFRFPFTGP
jgi:hypothetical protein